jgi:hypothetical protein
MLCEAATLSGTTGSGVAFPRLLPPTGIYCHILGIGHISAVLVACSKRRSVLGRLRFFVVRARRPR